MIAPLSFFGPLLLRAVSPSDNSTIAEPYAFVKELGQGAYGCVISARHETTGEMCAVKKVRVGATAMPLGSLRRTRLIRRAASIDYERLFKEDLDEAVPARDQAAAPFPGPQERASPVLPLEWSTDLC